MDTSVGAVSAVAPTGSPDGNAAPKSGSKTGDNSGTETVRPSSTKTVRPTFDGDRAYGLLTKQCDFGPRPLGTPAHEKLRVFLTAEMKKYADQTIEQKFDYRGMPVTNIIGVFYPAGASAPAKKPVLLLAHWDTRPVADGPFSSESRGSRFVYGAQGWNRTTPIIGANDGASGAAALLELARLFKQRKPDVGVLLLLDDGEDYGDFKSDQGRGEGVELGSRYFATHYMEDARFGYPDFGILLDMIGAKNLVLPKEQYSQNHAPGTNSKVFGIAEELGYKKIFLYGETQDVGDDHIALNEAGIPTIDLIHPLPNGSSSLGYRYWHTLQDTADKCSGASLKVVGETVAEVIYRETPAP